MRAARSRQFVGREAELTVFTGALARVPGAPSVLFLHGPGGVGKSALLRRMGDIAATAGRAVVPVDGRDIDGTPAGFESEAADVLAAQEPVLLVDAFEHCGRLEAWFRDVFLPALPSGAVVVVAGREPPQAQWRADPAWHGVLLVRKLRELPRKQARQLVRARGVPPGAEESVLAFAGGHPLALSLATEVAARDPAWAIDAGPPVSDWAADAGPPVTDIVRELLAQLVGDVPSPTHRKALEVCAHALTTTESLLAAALPEHDPAPLFGWLRGLPYVEAGRHGLYPHDVVRTALIEDLRWRDTDGYVAMHLRMRQHLAERIRTAPPDEALLRAAEFTYLHRSGVLSEHLAWTVEGSFYEDRYRSPDREAVLRLAHEAEGAEQARIAGYWLDRQPEAFFVHRAAATGEPRGFVAWLRIAPDDAHAAADPVVAAIYRHSERVAPLRPGEQLAVSRYFVVPRQHRPSPVLDLAAWRAVAEVLRTKGVAATYFSVGRLLGHGPSMAHFGLAEVETVQVGAGRSVLYCQDWRIRSLQEWLEAHTEQERLGGRGPVPPAEGGLDVIRREEFAEAVRQALRGWGSAAELEANRLTAARLVAGADDPVEALRAALVGAVDALRTDPRTVKQHQALAATYFQGPRTQEGAAARLGMPFSTYRRHLARGITAVIDQLWRQELGDRP